jgi:hypothetical protein
MNYLFATLIGIAAPLISYIPIRTFKEWRQGIRGPITMDVDDSRYLIQGLDW